LDRDLTKSHVVSGRRQPAPPELGLLANLRMLNVRRSRLIDRDLTVTCFFQVGTSSRHRQQQSASFESSSSEYDMRVE
jgi:hypothetical protein